MSDSLKYKCIKVRLKKLNPSTETINQIQKAVYHENSITYKTYLTLRFWVLKYYHSNQPIPLITENTIKMAMMSVKKVSRNPLNENLALYNEFKALNLSSDSEAEDGKKISQILNNYSATSILTAIENNIKFHFIDYINRFVNVMFHSVMESNPSLKYEIKDELKKVKTDIIYNTSESYNKYHVWLNRYRLKLVPPWPEKGYIYDVKANPQKYLPYMIYMSSEIERLNAKTFQFFPLRTKLVPHHITLDTTAVNELLIDKKTKYEEERLVPHQEWKDLFTFPKNLKIKDYIFNNMIHTDGYCASIQFIHESFLAQQNAEKAAIQRGKQETKGMTSEQRKARQEEKAKKQKEQAKIKAEQKAANPPQEKKEEDVPEFSYFTEVDKKDLEGRMHIFIDPNKKTLLYMMNDNGKFVRYTNKQHIKATKRLKYQRLMQRFRNELGIMEEEEKFSKFNSRTCDLTEFQTYINQSKLFKSAVGEKYQKEKFQQYRWYAFINKTRAEDNMMNFIENEYNCKNPIIIFGNGGVNPNMKHSISTPNISIKRKLKERFSVYHIDEFRTSIVHHKMHTRCSNLKLPDKDGKLQSMHPILTFQMENKRLGCINRDKNACKNMKYIFDHHMVHNERPYVYTRAYKLP